MKWNATLAIVLMLFLLGCETGPTMIECTPPLLLDGKSCCMDADRNGVCDIKEATPAVEKTEEPATTLTPEETKTPEETSEEEPAPAEATLEGAEEVGRMFAERWQLKQYNTMYVLFTPEVKALKTATEFTAIMELDPLYKRTDKVEFKGVERVDNDTAELKITYHTNVQDIELTPATVEFVYGEWKVNAFADVFSLDLYDAACSGYRQNKQYKTSDCAFDLAKKVGDAKYCDKSECRYVECLKSLGKPAGMTQEAEQCFNCQPVMKTTNECILDVAIKHDKIAACNVISEDHYSDKYCFCYGGFAKHKGTPAYCNTITDPDNKDLCLKGYEGEYC